MPAECDPGELQWPDMFKIEMSQGLTFDVDAAFPPQDCTDAPHPVLRELDLEILRSLVDTKTDPGYIQ